MRNQFVRHKLKHKVNSIPDPHIQAHGKDWGSTGEINSGPAIPPTATLGTRTLEQGIEREKQRRDLCSQLDPGMQTPLQCGDVSRMQAGWETPAALCSCPLQGKEVMEARWGGRGKCSVARGPLARVSLLMPGMCNLSMKGL